MGGHILLKAETGQWHISLYKKEEEKQEDEEENEDDNKVNRGEEEGVTITTTTTVTLGFFNYTCKMYLYIERKYLKF
jgi:hypothetical protein